MPVPHQQVLRLPSPAGTAVADEEFVRVLTEKLASVGTVDPEPLADLFLLAGGPGDRARALRHVLQNFMLARTLAHASTHTTHYDREPYRSWAPAAASSEPDLGDLPLLRRETVVEHFTEFLSDDVTVRSVCHTSGTTGTPLDLYKSHEEIAFLQAYYRRLISPRASAPGLRPLVLTLPNVNHGVPVPMPSVGMTLVAGVTDDTLIQDARRVLLQRFQLSGHESRISILTGLPHHVLLLTSYLMEQGIDPRTLHMRSVTITGGFLSRNWITFLENAWGCLVNDRFTLTEAIGGASRVPGTDVYELDPHLVGEIVDPDSEARAAGPVGLLVLTNLHPFVQMQPLIRYTVGDVVRRVSGPGPLRFQFLGKAKNCVSWWRNGRAEWLLFSARVNELVNQFPDVNVYEWFSNVRVVHDRTVGSLPILSVTSETAGGRLTIRIAVELRYAPHIHPDRTEEIRRALVAGLRATPDTTLTARLDAGEVVLDIAFSAPGALNAPLVIKI